MRKLIGALCLAAAFAVCLTPGRTQEQTSQAAPPSSLAGDEAAAAQDAMNALNKVDELVALLAHQADTNRVQCLSAFGNAGFCDCLSSRLPMAIDFLRYVAITVATKEQIKYDTLSADKKTIVDDARHARDECVSAASP